VSELTHVWTQRFGEPTSLEAAALQLTPLGQHLGTRESHPNSSYGARVHRLILSRRGLRAPTAEALLPPLLRHPEDGRERTNQETLDDVA
jgi:hypothetical protein